MLKNITERTITVYPLTDDFYVEIENDGECSEFYMCNKQYPDKTLMYGLTNDHREEFESILRNTVIEEMLLFLDEFSVDENNA